MLQTRGLALGPWGSRRCIPLSILSTQGRWRAASVATDADACPQASGSGGAAPQREQTQQRQPAARGSRQTLDYTTLCACVSELQAQWVPSKVEEVG